MKKLRILHIEDNNDDAFLVQRALKKGGYETDITLVDSALDLREALEKGGPWDVVLSDYALPNYDGLSALQQVIAHDSDIPFILVSGAVGEETAVEIMKTGAKDFIMKDNLGRLVPAIARELVDYQLRKDKSRVEQQKRDLETQLWQAQKMEAIGTLAGGVAHDFNNILTAIIGYSELAVRELDDRPETKRKIEEVVKAGNRARELVQHILAFSRKNEADRETIDMGDVVREALELLRATTPSNIEFNESISSDCGQVKANAIRIHQVILNLCTNSAYAMAEKGGVLTVSLAPVTLALGELKGRNNIPGDYVRLTISDTGTGIDEKIISKVFDPYFTTKPQGVGTGLGLALVLGIVKSHSGYITVESAKGEGTTFDIYFPLDRSHMLPGLKGGDQAKATEGGNENILVVDDEEIIIQFTKEILEGLGYRVAVARDGVEAVNLFKEDPQKFDLMITDMTMPKMMGIELSRTVLQIRPDLPIILCTGHSDQVNADIASRVGIREYCMKPISGMEMARIVRRLLDEGSCT